MSDTQDDFLAIGLSDSDDQQTKGEAERKGKTSTSRTGQSAEAFGVVKRGYAVRVEDGEVSFPPPLYELAQGNQAN